MEEQFVCEVCNTERALWGDDDGVLRCDACHANVATAWGGDYNELIRKRNGEPQKFERGGCQFDYHEL
jgi:hypothetical protein